MTGGNMMEFAWLGVLALAPTTMSLGLMAAGLAALGLVVFGLQRLRVRHRTRVVVTTLFWREAIEESRARTLTERFRHPLTYLLLLAIAGLLWLSTARLEADRDGGLQHTFLLDRSASMAVGDRFDGAVDALAEALEQAPRERVQVLLCGAQVETILAPGDDRALLRARLEGLGPEAAPASVERAFVDALAVDRGAGAERSPRRFVVVGDAPISENALEQLRETDSWERLLPLDSSGETGGTQLGNAGIVALGAAPAASGIFDAVDLYVEVQGAGAQGSALAVTLGAEPVALTKQRSASDGAARWIARDLRPAARGAALDKRTVVAALAGEGSDGLSFDDRAELVLPELRLIRVFMDGLDDPEAASALAAACGADPAVEMVGNAARADVVITGGEVATPSLRIAPASGGSSSIELRAEPSSGAEASGAEDTPDSRLAAILGSLALDRVDATRLASEIGRPLGATLEVGAAGSARSLRLWTELLRSDLCSFTESRAFPVVVARALRWLARVPELTPYQAAGRDLPERVVGGFGDSFTSDGEARSPWPLLDPASTRLAGADPGAAGGGLDADAIPDDSGPWRPATWLLVLALALLIFEWIAFQRGRIA